MAKPRQTLFAGGTARRRKTAGAIQGLVVSNLKEAMERVKNVNEQTAQEVGDIILRRTLPKVPMETGKLRNTGRVEVGSSRRGNTTVQVKFGDSDVDYAVFVHENMPRNVPEKQYTTPGTGHHYLQNGAAESVNEIDALLKRKLRAVISGSSGGESGQEG